MVKKKKSKSKSTGPGVPVEYIDGLLNRCKTCAHSADGPLCFIKKALLESKNKDGALDCWPEAVRLSKELKPYQCGMYVVVDAKPCPKCGRRIAQFYEEGTRPGKIDVVDADNWAYILYPVPDEYKEDTVELVVMDIDNENRKLVSGIYLGGSVDQGLVDEAGKMFPKTKFKILLGRQSHWDTCPELERNKVHKKDDGDADSGTRSGPRQSALGLGTDQAE